jgi:hypothetical protein
MVRGELRMYCRGLVLLLVLVQAGVVIAALLIGQAYARDQIDAAVVTTVNTCGEIVAMGIPEDQCEFVQLQQRYSRAQLLELAGRIGPPAASSTTPSGAAALALGHGSTLVGLAGLVFIASLVLGGETASGLGAARDRSMLGRRAFTVRSVALLLVWVTSMVVIAALAWFASTMAAIDLGWDLGGDHRATWRFVALRLGGAGVTAACFVLPIIAARRVLTTRARWFVAGSFVACAIVVLAGTGAPFRPPSNVGLGLMRFEGDLLSYIDRLPAELVVTKPGVDSALIAGLAFLAFVGTCGVFGALERRRAPSGGT